MPLIERVDRILFELCGEAMLDEAERHWVAVRSWYGIPANAAFAICAYRMQHRR